MQACAKDGAILTEDTAYGQHYGVRRTSSPPELAHRRVAPGGAAAHGAPLAGAGRAGTGRCSASLRFQLLSLPRQRAPAATRNPHYTGTFVFENDFAALCAGTTSQECRTRWMMVQRYRAETGLNAPLYVCRAVSGTGQLPGPTAAARLSCTPTRREEIRHW